MAHHDSSGSGQSANNTPRKHPVNPETGLPQTSRQATWPYPVASKPFTMSYSVLVEAPAEDLWAMAANPHRHHELDGSGDVQGNATGPEELAEGDTFGVWNRRVGIPYKFTMHVTASIKDRVVEFAHPGKHRWRWEFEPSADNPQHTIVTETFDYSRVSPFMIRVHRTLGTFEHNSRSIQATLSKLAEKYLQH